MGEFDHEARQAMEAVMSKIGEHFGVTPGDVAGLFEAIEEQSAELKPQQEIIDRVALIRLDLESENNRLLTENARLERKFQALCDENEAEIERTCLLTAEVTKLKKIEAVALDVFYQHGYHEGACMCVDCQLAMILGENSDSYRQDQATVKAMSTASGTQKPDYSDGMKKLGYRSGSVADDSRQDFQHRGIGPDNAPCCRAEASPEYLMSHMMVCRECGDKRCPKADDCTKACADQSQPTHCTWLEVDEFDYLTWETDCGRKWEFMADGPVENGIKFCHGCGKPIQLSTDESNHKFSDNYDDYGH